MKHSYLGGAGALRSLAVSPVGRPWLADLGAVAVGVYVNSPVAELIVTSLPPAAEPLGALELPTDPAPPLPDAESVEEGARPGLLAGLVVALGALVASVPIEVSGSKDKTDANNSDFI